MFWNVDEGGIATNAPPPEPQLSCQNAKTVNRDILRQLFGADVTFPVRIFSEEGLHILAPVALSGLFRKVTGLACELLCGHQLGHLDLF